MSADTIGSIRPYQLSYIPYGLWHEVRTTFGPLHPATAAVESALCDGRPWGDVSSTLDEQSKSFVEDAAQKRGVDLQKKPT